MVTVEKRPAVLPAVNLFHDYIKGETLATDLVLADTVNGEKVELNDEVAVGIEVLVN